VIAPELTAEVALIGRTERFAAPVAAQLSRAFSVRNARIC